MRGIMDRKSKRLLIWNIFCSICSEIKERIKKTKDEKKAKKAEVVSKQKVQGKGGNVPKAKGPKLGGGGGKRWVSIAVCLFY